MLFNSLPFILFVVLFFGLWPWMRTSNNRKWIWICLMSFLFYGWWDWRFLFLLIGTGTIDYCCALLMQRHPGRKKIFLWVSVFSNLACLSIFKYSVWLIKEFNHLMNSLGVTSCFAETVPEFSVVLPLGISFYTFNALSYTIDFYKGKSKPAENWLHFMAFISFFPHLVAGPIIRAKDVLQQLQKNQYPGSLQILNGVKLCLLGFFQKMVLADNLAVFVNAQFSDVRTSTDTLAWWFCMLAFAFQIYFDFNGYSSIARGIAKCCGIHFRLNFNHPYFSSSFSEFWRRWHISLSSFFRDYVYIPLGGNRGSKWASLGNLWTTMLLSGLWHGANFTFIVWGALHAFYLSLERLFSVAVSRYIAVPVVFVGVLIAWVFFRADSVSDAFIVIQNMFSIHYPVSLDFVKSNAMLVLAIGVVFELTAAKKTKPVWLRSAYVQTLLYLMLIVMIIYFRGPEQEFIYFQF